MRDDERTAIPSQESDFSAPWMRTTLLNTPSYIASAGFPTHVVWEKFGNQNDLMTVPPDGTGKDVPSVRATCAVVGIVSTERLYLEPHGNYNPNFEDAALETAKLQFQIISPSSHPEFNEDFQLGLNRIKSIQNKAITEGPKGEHFVVKDGQDAGLRFSWPLFEKRTAPHDASDQEDWTNDYPITEKYCKRFDDIVKRWRVTPLPAFNSDGQYINMQDLEISLNGSLVLVYFQLKHYAIKYKKMDRIGGNTFSAIATQVRILDSATNLRPAPYKSMLLKGPTVLPQSPVKKADQIAAARAFHPASATASSTSQEDRQISKAEGKRRAVDLEDEDATATEGETPITEQFSSKKKKKQNK